MVKYNKKDVRLILIKSKGCINVITDLENLYAEGINKRRKVYGEYCKYENKNK
jgi:hypothetical protein